MRCTCDDFSDSPCPEHGYGEFECDCGVRFGAPLVAKNLMIIECPKCKQRYVGEEDMGNGYWRNVGTVPAGPKV